MCEGMPYLQAGARDCRARPHETEVPFSMPCGQLGGARLLRRQSTHGCHDRAQHARHVRAVFRETNQICQSRITLGRRPARKAGTRRGAGGSLNRPRIPLVSWGTDEDPQPSRERNGLGRFQRAGRRFSLGCGCAERPKGGEDQTTGNGRYVAVVMGRSFIHGCVASRRLFREKPV